MLQDVAFEVLKSQENVFLTGEAGTGKTYLINKFIEYCNKNKLNVGVCASTGITAININGQTVHKLFGTGRSGSLSADQFEEYKSYVLDNSDEFQHSSNSQLTDKFLFSDELDKAYFTNKWHKDTREFLKSIDCLLIDEISMISGSHFEMIDYIMRRLKGSKKPKSYSDLAFKPFGGVKVIVVGDFFQLPPISRNSVYAFESLAWRELKLKVCYLEQQFRQEDLRLHQLLKHIREESVTENDYELLEGRANLEEPENAIRFFSKNDFVDKYNNEELAKLDSEEKAYIAERDGDESLCDGIIKNLLCPENLTLRVGARVIIVVNDNKNFQYQNGSLGTVTQLKEKSVLVELDSGITTEIFPQNFEISAWEHTTFSNIEEATEYCQKRISELEKDEDTNPENPLPYCKKVENSYFAFEYKEGLAKVSQLPLKLAYAITIHKSQGATLDTAIIDFSNMFAKGMGYVALSRLKSLDGLFIRYSKKGLEEYDDEVAKALIVNSVFKRALAINSKVAQFDRILKEMSSEVEGSLNTLSKMTFQDELF